MEAEIRSAWITAGVKLCLGLVLLCAVIGIRIVTASPQRAVEAVEAASPDAEPIRDQNEDPELRSHPQLEMAAEKSSVLARVVDEVREQLPGGPPASRDGDKLVSCRLDGRTQFMRADDCAMRRGTSRIIESDR